MCVRERESEREKEGERGGASRPPAPALEGAAGLTRARAGTVRWAESTFDGDARWEYRMQFAEDFEARAPRIALKRIFLKREFS